MSEDRIWLDVFTLRIFKKPRRAPAREKKPASEVRADSTAMRKAKTLAALHGVDIEREGPGAYWVTCDALLDTGNDPCEGNHFCADGREVLATVQAYADHFNAQEKKP